MCKKYFLVMLFILLAFLGMLTPDVFAYNAAVTKLVVDVDTAGRNPSVTGRIPLILIHGINGTDSSTFSAIDGTTAAEKDYFKHFIDFFYNSDLKNKYQLYRFHYISNSTDYPVSKLGQELQEWLDDFIQKHKITDSKFVIIAHSMGGLVARSYMQENKHLTGSYANQFGGERVEKLITLATPHHGTQIANKVPRFDPLLSFDWYNISNVNDLAIWGLEFNCFTCGISPNVVSRSDLRSDNYDSLWGVEYTNNDNETNDWLRRLNGITPNNNINYYDRKIKAYYGYIENDARVSLYGAMNAAEYEGYFISNAFPGGLLYADRATAYTFLGVLLERVIEKNANQIVVDIYNDGVVPVESAYFKNHDEIDARIGCRGHNHDDMRNGGVGGCGSSNLTLFSSIESDLNAIFGELGVDTISTAEYFIDADPGEGFATAITPSDGTFNNTAESVQFQLNTSNITFGVHNLFIRMRNAAGWGTPRKVEFYVEGDKHIAAEEYYIDTDPGAGNGFALAATDGAYDQVMETGSVAINTTNISTGLHTLYVRARNSEGHWGNPRQYAFEVINPLTITAAEYYVDTDPGQGLGASLNAVDGNLNSTAEAVQGILSTASLSYGTHKLYARAQDSLARWGATQSIDVLTGQLLTVAKSGSGIGVVTSGDLPQTINCGIDCTEIYNGLTVILTATPNASSSFTTWVGCPNASNNICIVSLSTSLTITASFTLNQYTVSTNASTGGTISPTSALVSLGSTTSFIVTPNTGYNIGTISGCTGNLAGNTYTTGAITGACTVNATFTLNRYTVSTYAGAGGSISPVSALVSHGTTTTFTVTPNTGYSIGTLSGCGGTLTGNTYTTSTITGVCTVAATFTPNSIHGACGLSDGGIFITAPTTNLCSVGNATTVGGTGPWTWSCTGLNGGTTASCSADSQTSTEPILWYNTGSGMVYAMTTDGAAITGGTVIWTEPDNAWTIVGRGDFDGDGVRDYVWRNSISGQIYLMFMVNASTVGSGAVVWAEPDPNWKIVASGDLNGDGKTDLIWWNSATGQVYGMLINGASTPSGAVIWTEPNTDWKIVAAGDLNNDTKADLIWWNSTTGQVFGMLMDGTTVSSSNIIWTEPDVANWRIVGAGDINGDGKADLIWRNRSTGMVFAMLMDGTVVSSNGVVWTEPDMNWDIVSIDYYNNDSNADLLWRNKSTGMVYLMPMNGLVAPSGGSVLWTEPDMTWRIMGDTEWLNNTYGEGITTATH